MYNVSRRNQAFTLVEIAMVLTIIGLIIGGIFAGINLIRSARLQSITSDVDRYEKAVQMFKEKYSYLPGDMPTATNFWGTDTSCGATPANVVPKTATCNGNGDGFIGDDTGVIDGGTVSTNLLEAFRMWQHLANAGFIDGSYNGTWSSRANQEDPGMNAPASKVPNSTFLLFYAQPETTIANWYPANYRHVIVYGAPSSATGNGAGPIPPYNPILTAYEAMSIDQKVDDGIPSTGKVMAYAFEGSLNSHCTNFWNAGGPGDYYFYNVTYGTTVNYCSLIFITGF